MNEGYAPLGWDGTTKPDEGIRDGEYNRYPSYDDRLFVRYAYNQQEIEFVEVPSSDSSAHITISSTSLPNSAHGQVILAGKTELWTPGDPTQGHRILLDVPLWINSWYTPMAVLQQSWTIQNTTGQALVRASIAVRGTDSNPLQWFSFGQYAFTHYEGSSINTVDVEHKSHRFGASGTIPPFATTNIAMQLDVWDWTTEHIHLWDVNGVTHPVGHVGIANLTFSASQPSSASNNVALTGSDVALAGSDVSFICNAAPVGQVLARGFRIINSEEGAVNVTKIEIARLQGRVRPSDLTQDAIDRAAAEGRLTTITIPPEHLDPEEELLIVLDAGEDLPEAIEQSRHLRFNLPELARGSIVTAVTIESDLQLTAKTFSGPNDWVYDQRGARLHGEPNVEAICETNDLVLVGTATDDDLLAPSDTSSICVLAHEGNDEVFSEAESGFIDGGDGDDLIVVDGGRARIYGGAGHDEIWLGPSWTEADVDAGPDDDVISAVDDAPKIILAGDGFDFVETGDGDDRIEGGAGGDVIFAGGGHDYIVPGAGPDVVVAGPGNDTVWIRSTCEYGAKWLDGGSGEDTLLLPGTVEEAVAAGIEFVNFEHIIENVSDHLLQSDCAPGGGL